MDIAKNPGETETNQLPKAFHFHHGITHSSQEKSRMMEKLWGDWFYNPKKKVWTNVQQPEDCEEPLQRGFCQWLAAVESIGWRHDLLLWRKLLSKPWLKVLNFHSLVCCSQSPGSSPRKPFFWGSPSPRYVMNPINQLIRAIMDKDSEKYEKMMARLGIVLKGGDSCIWYKHHEGWYIHQRRWWSRVTSRVLQCFL